LLGRLGAAHISPPPLASTSSIEQEHAFSLCATALSARDALQDVGNVSARSTSTCSHSPTQSNCVFVGGCGKSRVIATLQHFAACWGVGERLAPTAVLLGGSTLHSLLGSQRAKSAVNVDEDDGEQVHDRSSQGRARGAV
jgi:hypothetical protein